MRLRRKLLVVLTTIGAITVPVVVSIYGEEWVTGGMITGLILGLAAVDLTRENSER